MSQHSRTIGFALRVIRNANATAHGETIWTKAEKPPQGAGGGKLSPEQVRMIRAANPRDLGQMAQDLGMSKQTLLKIRLGVLYAWVI